jgi:hypothetical protein
MWHVDRGLSEEEQIHNSQSSISTDETVLPSRISNGLMGIVISKTERLTRTRLRIRIGKRVDLRVSWQTALHSPGTVNIGQMIWVKIPEGAVHLEAGGFRCGKQRLNRWIGRVVLVNRTDQDLVTTVKLYRESITLKSAAPVMGACATLSVWDTVNIVVDPQQIELVSVCSPCSPGIPVSEFFSKGKTTRVGLRLR